MKTKDGAAVVGIAGWSGVGKTTFLEKLVRELKGRGYRVGTVKHTSHGGGFDIPGSDSWRHAQAGSEIAILVGREQIATFERLDDGLALDQVAARVAGVNVLLAEGYKRTRFPKVEVSRREHPEWGRLCSELDDLVALVTDEAWLESVPTFGLDDVEGIADLLRQAGFLDGSRD